MGDTPYMFDRNQDDKYPLIAALGMIYARPPEILTANLSGSDVGNVTITWKLSPDDGSGANSVIEYRLYRNQSLDVTGLGYGLIASIPNGTSEFTDVAAGEGDPNNYFYRVCAVDSENKSQCTEGQAAKFTRYLSRGPNLVSVPLIQSNKRIETVLQTVSYDKAWSYDSFTQGWISIAQSKPYLGDFTEVDSRIGIWVNVTAASNLTVGGIVPSVTTISLRFGWNLVGFPSFNSTYTFGDLKSETGASVFEGFDPSTNPFFLKEFADTETMEAGSGYWVWANGLTVWTVKGYG